MVNKVLNITDLVDIVNFFKEKQIGENVSIEIELVDQHTMNKVNEDFYYKTHQSNLVENPKELIVNIQGYKFKYFIKDA